LGKVPNGQAKRNFRSVRLKTDGILSVNQSCKNHGLSNIKRNIGVTYQAARKPLMLTKPINNTGLSFKRQGLCIFIMSRNLRDFALTQKNKTKPKDFPMCVVESKH